MFSLLLGMLLWENGFPVAAQAEADSRGKRTGRRDGGGVEDGKVVETVPSL